MSDPTKTEQRMMDSVAHSALLRSATIVPDPEILRLRSWLGHIGASTQDADVLGDTVRALRGDDVPEPEGVDSGDDTQAAQTPSRAREMGVGQ